jgi:enhancing lycopene biosynthesis protein 2
MKIAVLLHGCGVYDGTEIQEAVLTLLAIQKAGHTYFCVAPNVFQHHVIDHTTGQEMPETRNVLVESARIARGAVQDLSKISPSDFDALALPGGFGTAKNITKWAFEGPDGPIDTQVKNLIVATVAAQKPIVALCMSPTTVAKALEGSAFNAQLSVGSTAAASPYDIGAISAGMEKIGAQPQMATIAEVAIDHELKIISAPCYMMEANIAEVAINIELAIAALAEFDSNH